MREAADAVLDVRARPPEGFGRFVGWSFAVHAVALLAVVAVPPGWFGYKPPKPLMVISLGGAPGPRTTGMTPLGGRPVEEVAPPPRRAEPIRPATTKPDVMAVPTKPAAKPAEPPKPEPARPPASVTRPPATGREVTAGTSAVETGARGQGTGLAQGGGGGTGALLDVADFCCWAWVDEMRARIEANWVRDQPERGRTIMKFTIHRDGSIQDIEVERSSGSGLLDRAARAALIRTKLPPLPDEYKDRTLTVHLTFPYGGA